MPSPTYTTRITAIHDVAPEVRELVLAPPPERLEFVPGQWLSLHLPVGERPPLVRAYSLAVPPSPSGELSLCLDRVPEGLGSTYLFTLEPGDEVTFGGPLGSFVLPETDADMLWLAQYTGIVPFRAMLLHLKENPPPGQVTLVYRGETPDHLPYHAELLRAAEELPWFELLTTVDKAEGDWAGQTRPALELLPELVGARRDLAPLVCGKREFVRPIRDFFYGLGYERRSVRWENYD